MCEINSGTPPIVRAEGRAELLGDVLVSCHGGIPGNAYLFDLTVYLNTMLASLDFGAKSEALLLINEPRATTPLILGENVFQAEPLPTRHALRFQAVKLIAPVSGQVVTARLTNVRANAYGLGVSSTQVPNQITEFFSFSNYSFEDFVAITEPNATVAYVVPGLKASIESRDATAINLSNCSARNASLLASASASGAAVSFLLSFREGFANAFRKRLEGTAQNVSGTFYGTETGYYAPGAPSADGVNRAGLAMSGTRLIARFSNIPAGLALFVTTNTVGLLPITSLGQAQLIEADANSSGTSGIRNPTAVAIDGIFSGGIAPVNIVNGTGTAVWEVQGSNPAEEEFNFGVVAAYPAGIAPGNISIEMQLGPVTEDANVVPRFGGPATLRSVPVLGCGAGLPDLVFDGVSVSPSVPGAGRLTLSGLLLNRGTSSSPAFSYSAKILRRETDTVPIYSPEPIRSTGLFAGSGLSIPGIQLPPSLDLGLYWVKLSADVNNEVVESAESNNSVALPFTVSSCALVATSTNAVVSPVGGTFYLPVNTCSSSTAVSSFAAPWLHQGVGGFGLIADPNTTGQTRSAVVRFAGIDFAVTQTAVSANCAITLQYPVQYSSQPVLASGAVETLSINTSSPTCQWTVAVDQGWAQVYPLSGTGNGSVQLTIFPNFGQSIRRFSLQTGNAQFSQSQNGVTDAFNDRFVRLLYFNFFGRLPSASEVAFQAGALNAGLQPADLVVNFLNSQEFNIGGRFIAGLYVGLLGRDAEYGGWLFQRNAMATGVASPQQLVANFLNSAEFALKFGTLDDSALVRLLYRNILLREASSEEVQYQAGALRSGVSRVALATNFLNSAEFRLGTGPRLTSFLLYATLLFREATPAEFDNGSVALAAGTPLRSAVNSLVSSSEFTSNLN